MLSKVTSEALCEVLLEMAHCEKQIEGIRQQLGGVISFEPYSAFRCIDRTHKKFVNTTDIQQFLLQNGGYSYSQDEALVFIHAYDTDRDEKLSYTEFLRSILSYDNKCLREEVSQRMPAVSSSELQRDLRKLLANLISSEIEWGLRVNVKKEVLSRRGDFSPKICFEAISQTRLKSIDGHDIYKFFRSNSILFYDDEILALHRRIDVDQDGSISLTDFSQAVSLKNQRANLTIATLSDVDDRKQRCSYFESPVSFRKNKPSRSPNDRLSCSPSQSQGYYKSIRDGIQASVLERTKKLSRVSSQIEQFNEKTSTPFSSEEKIFQPSIPASSNKKNNLEQESSHFKRILPSKITHERLLLEKPLDSEQTPKFSMESKLLQSTPIAKESAMRDRSQSSSVSDSSVYRRQQQQDRAARDQIEYELYLKQRRFHSPTTAVAERSILEKRNSSPFTRELQETDKSESKHQTLKRRSRPLPDSSTIDLAQTVNERIKVNNKIQGRKQSISSFLSEEIVPSLLAIIATDKRRERALQDLSLRPDFRLSDISRIIEASPYRNAVSPSHLREFLQRIDLPGHSADVFLYIRRYAQSTDPVALTFNDIAKSLTPMQSEYAKLLSKRDTFNYDGSEDIQNNHHLNLLDVYSKETMNRLREAFAILIDSEKLVERTRASWKQMASFDFNEVFSALDQDGDGFIIANDVQMFFSKQAVFCSDSEATSLIRRLDLDGDSAVSFAEFVQELSPKIDV